jgi:hypothetical protein
LLITCGKGCSQQVWYSTPHWSKVLAVRRKLILPTAIVLTALVSAALLPLSAKQDLPVYFDLGPQLVEEFHGTYEFKYKRVEFVRDDGAAYIVRSSGNESPTKDRIVVKDGYVYWVLGWSGEKWIALKVTLRTGDQWQHRLRGSSQRYRVVNTDLTVSVPAGDFQHCTKVEVSWVAHEHDDIGPQKNVIYLAPHLGIIKEEKWSNGEKWHEEVLTSYGRTNAQ